MPIGRCVGCHKRTQVTEVRLVRKYSKKSWPGGLVCKRCWDGHGDSWPVLYWP